MLVTCRQSAGLIEAVIRGKLQRLFCCKGVFSFHLSYGFHQARVNAVALSSADHRSPHILPEDFHLLSSSLPRRRVQGHPERFVDDLWSFNVPTRSLVLLVWVSVVVGLTMQGLSCLICMEGMGSGRALSACFILDLYVRSMRVLYRYVPTVACRVMRCNLWRRRAIPRYLR